MITALYTLNHHNYQHFLYHYYYYFSHYHARISSHVFDDHPHYAIAAIILDKVHFWCKVRLNLTK